MGCQKPIVNMCCLCVDSRFGKCPEVAVEFIASDLLVNVPGLGTQCSHRGVDLIMGRAIRIVLLCVVFERLQVEE